jgi:hypothetical protein
MGYGTPHLVRPACPFTARACGPFLFRRFAPLAASVAHCPPAASAVRPVITARATPPKPAGSPPRPACGPVRPFPPLCPSKPATARRGASLARPVTAPAPACPLASPPRPAEARPLVTARPGAPKPATGRGSPLPPVRRPASPPCPSAVRLPLARRRPSVRGDHRPPPPACRPPPPGAPPGPPPGPPPAGPARKKGVKNRNLTRRPRIKPDCKKVVKAQTVSISKEWGTPMVTLAIHIGVGRDFF